MQKTNTDWNKIYTDLSPKLLGICRRYIADLQNAEDIVQESFITAIQKNHQLKDEKAVFGWLKKIVVNNALQQIRKTSKEHIISSETSEIPDTITEMTPFATDEKHILVYDFSREELLKSIDNLPSHHKSVFNLYYIENCSHAEISKLLEIPVNTSKSHLMRAKKAVQNYLIQNFGNHKTSKNKTAQLFIFLGFGNLLWAQAFQNKFSDFTIIPSQNLEIPSDIAINSRLSTSKHYPQKKIIIAATFLIIIICTVLLFNPANSLTTKKNISKTDRPTEHPEIKKTEINRKISVAEKPLKNISQKSEKPETENEKIISSVKKINVSKIKDSAESAPQKVIIVKKIIQRDTIFIER